MHTVSTRRPVAAGPTRISRETAIFFDCLPAGTCFSSRAASFMRNLMNQVPQQNGSRAWNISTFLANKVAPIKATIRLIVTSVTFLGSFRFTNFG